MSGIKSLPKNWKSFVCTTYPGGWIVPNKIECHKIDDKDARFIYSRWKGITFQHGIGNITERERDQLEAHCADMLRKERI